MPVVAVPTLVRQRVPRVADEPTTLEAWLRQVLAGVSLDDVRAEYSVRWIVTHMIEEYARHNGHADLLRERIDGATGA